MEREHFIFYKSFYEATKYLSDEDKWKLLDIICKYWFYWEEPDIDGYMMWMFSLIKPQLDANNKKYIDWCKWWDFWALWWAPKWNKNACKTYEKQLKQPHNNPKTTPKSKKTTPNDNDNDNVNDNENEKEKEKEKGGVVSVLDSALDEFTEMRKKIKKPLTSSALKRLLARLDKLAKNDEEKVAILNQSVDHCWQDVYPLKEPINTEPQTNKERIDFFDKCRDEWTHRSKILDVYGREKFEKVKHLRCEWCTTWVVDEKFKL